ncbi:MAG TPA: NAD(P)/FAD-dependent oxidoreductase [Bryobacteraceae bacterium]|nr:NAD(P)/FAD-dependent oxidoreductase [Bryobacteraceae bacterium]
MSNVSEYLDVIVVGGGPAGLSAALVLARARRRVLVVDAGNPRNAASNAMHGFLSRDGMPPREFLKLAREDVRHYGVELREGSVEDIRPCDTGFEVSLGNGADLHSRKVLLATGVVDRVPQLNGIEKFYGKSVHHCPYCDGWEHRDGRVAAYGNGKAGAMLSIKLKIWTEDVVLCTDGPSRIPEPQRGRLARLDVRVIEKKIARLDGVPPQLERIVFEDGTALDRTGMFFGTGNAQRSDLISRLGCDMTRKGAARISRGQRSTVPGVFICGDAAEDSQYVIVAASHGARAAMAINQDLLEEDLR